MNLQKNQSIDSLTMEGVQTRAKRIVSSLELLAGCKVVALGRYALEVVGVVLETSSHT
jgi:hypothetical protein